jgi:hypothetical protein
MPTANDSTRRGAAALALARGRPVAEAAADAGVTPRTVHRWREDEAFMAEVRSLRDGLFNEASQRLSGLSDRAAERLGELVESANDCVALSACKTVIAEAARLRELLEIEERVAALEQKINERTRS